MRQSHVGMIFAGSLAGLFLFEKYSTMLESYTVNIFPTFPYFTYFDLGIAIIGIIGFIVWLMKSSSNIDEKLSKIEDHRTALFNDYVQARQRITGWISEESFFNLIAFKNNLLQHLFTGYPQIYENLTCLVSMDREIRTSPTLPNRAFVEESNRISTEYNQEMSALMTQISLKTAKFGGVCNNCINMHNKKTTKNLKELQERLNSFTMPF